MTARELLKKLQEIPEQYLDKIATYENGYDDPQEIYGTYIVEENEYLSDYTALSQTEVNVLKDLKDNLESYTKEQKLSKLGSINLPVSEDDSEEEINDYITWLVNDLTLDREKGTLILT